MQPIRLILGAALITGCASLNTVMDRPEDLTGLWADAQAALARRDFQRAESIFGRLAEDHGETLEGREALFYLGSIRIDPRNPAWNSTIAERWLSSYLAHMGEGGPRIYRYPEAIILHEIARQLNLPPEQRIASLRPGERVVTVEEQVIVPAEQSRELTAEVERLRQLVAERDATIRAQQEELDRIRRTLTGPGPGRSN